LKKNLNKKVMVFFSSCNSVKYHRCAGNCRSLCGGSGLEVWIGERGGGARHQCVSCHRCDENCRCWCDQGLRQLHAPRVV
jgi:hypothetical protein